LRKTTALIIVCILASLFYWYIDPELAANLFIFEGAEFFQGKFWTPVTSIFLHGNLVHLAGNMLFLYIFGKTLEDELGAGKMLAVFFVGGILSFIFSPLFYGAQTKMIGASAAIFTLSAVVMLTKPLKWSWLFLMPLGLVAFIYFLFNIVAAYYAIDGSIGYLSHIFGFLIGFPFGIAWSRGKWIRNILITILILMIYVFIMILVATILNTPLPFA